MAAGLALLLHIHHKIQHCIPRDPQFIFFSHQVGECHTCHTAIGGNMLPGTFWVAESWGHDVMMMACSNGSNPSAIAIKVTFGSVIWPSSPSAPESERNSWTRLFKSYVALKACNRYGAECAEGRFGAFDLADLSTTANGQWCEDFGSF